MSKTNSTGNTAIIITAILFTGIAGFLIAKAFGMKKSTISKSPGPEEGSDIEPKKKVGQIIVSDSQIAAPIGGYGRLDFGDWKFPIRLTQKNDSVKNLQRLLLVLDPKSIPDGDTGYFDTQTQSALQNAIGKKSVDSMADIDNIKQKIGKKLAPSISAITSSLFIK